MSNKILDLSLEININLKFQALVLEILKPLQ